MPVGREFLLFTIGHLGRPSKRALWRFFGEPVESPEKQVYYRAGGCRTESSVHLILLQAKP